MPISFSVMSAWSKQQHFGKNNWGEWDGGHHTARRLMNDGQSCSKTMSRPLFLCLSSPVYLIIPFALCFCKTNMRLFSPPLYAAERLGGISRVVERVKRMIKLFIWRGTGGSHWRSCYSKREIERRVGCRIQERGRPPVRQNVIERCSASAFHLILAGSASGEIPQTYLHSSAMGNGGGGGGEGRGGVGRERDRDRKKKKREKV